MAIDAAGFSPRSLSPGKLRVSEGVIASYFVILLGYALLVPRFAGARLPAAVTLIALVATYAAILWAERRRPSRFWGYFRDWLTLALTLYSYRAMEWFAPAQPLRRWEAGWVQADHLLLDAWRLRDVIEALGPVIPALLEIAYALVYALPAFCIAMLYLHRRSTSMDFLLSSYLVGLYVSYLQFPFWPSEPP